MWQTQQGAECGHAQLEIVRAVPRRACVESSPRPVAWCALVSAPTMAPKHITVFLSLLLHSDSHLRWRLLATNSTSACLLADATSGPDDRFTATLAAREASTTGVRLAVAVGGTTVQELNDVVFGDVFLFSGQSNIDIPEACVSAALPSDEQFTLEQGHKMHRNCAQCAIAPCYHGIYSS